jgi:hypothetical protein
MLRLFMFLLLASISTLSQAESYWNHNGSLMRLESNGDERYFYYQSPRSGMVKQGVRPGTLLFSGRKEGDYYYGTARVFSRHCPGDPLEYSVEGPVVEGGQGLRVILTGSRPVHKRCRETGRHKTDRLVFQYRYSD